MRLDWQLCGFLGGLDSRGGATVGRELMKAIIRFERELLAHPDSMPGDEVQRQAMFKALRSVRGGKLFDEDQAWAAVDVMFATAKARETKGLAQ